MPNRHRSRSIKTPDRRLRVFVSSTLNELAPERASIRRGIEKLRLSPVMFESGARPHPATEVYRKYLAASDVFIGVYWRSYGWIAPEAQISGLEDEYLRSSELPRLLYIKDAAADREPPLQSMLDRITQENAASYKFFSNARELQELVENDLALLLSERFDAAVESADKLESPVALPRTTLFGREHDLKRAEAMLRRPDVAMLTLTGVGGAGKTRLSSTVALLLREHFADGVHIVKLESVREAPAVIPAIGEALGIRDVRPETTPLQALTQFLSSKDILLVLDNLEHLAAAGPEVAALLETCPGLKVLATSRAALRIRVEKEFKVGPLAVPGAEIFEPALLQEFPSVALFLDRAQAVNPLFALTAENGAAVAEICRRLDGLPLALELAAARVATLSLQQILSRLQGRFEVLDSQFTDLPERQQTVFNTIDWSYRLLSPAVQRLYRLLSIFAGGWTLEAAEAVGACEAGDPAQVLDGLSELVKNSLVVAEVDRATPRYRVLETVRQHASSLLSPCELAEACERHLEFFLRLAEEAEPHFHEADAPAWIARVEGEQDNFRVALERSSGEQGLRLAAALYWWWYLKGMIAEGRRWCAWALSRRGDDPASAVLAKSLRGAGILAYRHGDYAEAQRRSQEGLEVYMQSADSVGAATCRRLLGVIACEQGDYGSAFEHHNACLDVARRQGDRALEAATLNNLGLVEWRKGNLEGAKGRYEESLSLNESLGDLNTATILYMNLGVVLLELGRVQESRNHHLRCLALATDLGDRWSLAAANTNLGNVSLKEGDFETASSRFSLGIEAFEEVADPLGGSNAHCGMTYAMLGLGRSQEAEHHARLALEACMGIGDPRGIAEAMDCIGSVYADSVPLHAAQLWGAAMAIRTSIGAVRAPSEESNLAPHWERCRASLGEAPFASMLREGSTLSAGEALSLGKHSPGVVESCDRPRSSEDRAPPS